MDLLDMEGESERRVLDRSSERDDMEEGELSDADEVDNGFSPGPQPTKPRVILERVGRALPDLLNDIGVTEFNVLDEETTVKLGARAKRFNLDSHITYAEVSRMYETLGISEKDRKPGVSNSSWRLETIHVRGTELMEEEDVMDYFKDYNPLEVFRVDNMSCNVAWGTAANSGKAMLGLSRPIASSHTRKVIHRIASSEEMEEERVVVEEDVDEVEGEKPVDPADIEVAVPQGSWRIGAKHEKAEALFLRFAKVEEVGERMNFGELDARSRSLTMGGGLLSRSKRENLLAARDEQLEREQAERDREIDGKNPWGSIAENWGSGGRREQAREYPIPLEHMDRPPRSFRIGVKDWDAPEDEFDPVRVRQPMAEGGKRKRSIKDRLEMDKRVVDEDYEESEEEAAETFISEGDDDSDIEWTKKRKRPRMGMVADMVEKKNVKDRIGGDQKQKNELIKRKIANKTSIEVFEEEEEEEVDDSEDEEARRVNWRGREDLRLSVKLEDRPMLSLTKRLNERFRGGRLAGRLGDGVKVEVEEREVKNIGEREGRESRRQYSRDVESDGGDSLENDDGEDLKSDFGNAANMVIHVNQSDDETMDVDLKYEDARGREREKESGRNDAERERRERDKRRENEARERRRESEREKERERETKEREREKRKDLERERELERINREKKDQERELSRLKEREREKRRDRDALDERTKRDDKHREREKARQRERERERKDRDRDREREREKEQERRREREKERSKATSKSTSRKKKDESEDESSDASSDESSDSESESESSSNSESSSDSSSDTSGKSSSDSESDEDDGKKKKVKETKDSSQRTDRRKETSKDALKKDESRDRKDAKAKSRDDKKSEEKKVVKKEKKEENSDDKKKADELRNKLKNYLQAAQAAKEKKKDAEK